MIFGIDSIENAFDVTVAISDDQQALENEWRDAVNGDLPHNAVVPSMFRAALLSSRIAKIVTLEEEITVSGSDVADFINEQFIRFRKNLSNGFRAGVEKCCNGGRVLAFLEQLNNRIDIVIYENNEYFPVEYDRSGALIDVIITYTMTRENDEHYYTLAGRYIYNEQTQQMTVIYKGFRSTDEEKLGQEIKNIKSVEEWSLLEPEVIYNNQEEPWFFEITMPKREALFAKAIDLFRKLDEHKAMEEREFANSANRLILPVEFSAFDERTGRGLIDPKSDVYIFHDSDDKTIQTFNPNIRNANYSEGTQDILRDIEMNCEVAFGTLSRISDVDKTATEVRAGQQTTFTTISDIQKIWETAFRKIAVAMRSIAITFLGYSYAEFKEKDFVFKWNDGILVDEKEEAELTKGIAGLLQVNQDIISPQERRAYLFKRLPDLASLTEDELTAAINSMPGLPEVVGE